MLSKVSPIRLFYTYYYNYWTTESERNRNQRCDPSEVSADWERAPGDWRAEINGFQYQLQNKLSTNLNNYLVNNLDKIYLKAKRGAGLKIGLGTEIFPDTCPYTLEEILGE